ncbi:hypothetical protein B1748_04345 [Paenibacillus sp. MY03]|jgi:heme exporter protein D|nr:hypothetical protein B1748_04345 [Paenibacillus sp. MY03]
MGKVKNKGKGKLKHFMYILIAAGMLFYAFAAVDSAEWGGAGGVFWFMWLAFAIVIIAANANMLLLTEEKREALSHVKRAKVLRREQAAINFVNRQVEKKARKIRGH